MSQSSTENPGAKPTNKKQIDGRCGSGAHVFCILVACAALGLSAYQAYRGGASMRAHSATESNALTTQVNDLQAAVSQLKAALAAQSDSTEALTKKLDAGLSRDVVDDRNNLSHVYRVVYQAQFALDADRDAPEAQRLLRVADQSLLHKRNAKHDGIRKSIAKLLAQLASLPTMDDKGVIFQLDAVIDRINQLLYAPKPFKASEGGQPASPAAPQSLWRRIWVKTVDGVRSLIVVRRHDKAIEPLLTYHAWQSVKENIIQKLMMAQWAMLHSQAELYHHNLVLAKQWLSQYFVNNAAAVSQLVDMLEKTNHYQFVEKLPDLTPLLEMIKSAQSAAVAEAKQLSAEQSKLAPLSKKPMVSLSSEQAPAAPSRDKRSAEKPEPKTQTTTVDKQAELISRSAPVADAANTLEVMEV